MTKKDYELLVEVIRPYAVGWEHISCPKEAEEFVEKLCITLKADNPRFNEEIFRGSLNVPIQRWVIEG